MELTKAIESLTSLLEKYRSKFSKFDTKTTADVYLADSNTFTNRPIDDPFANVLCASLTIAASDSKDENEMFGFDIILNLNKKKLVKNEEFDQEIEDFKKKINEFLSKLENASDVDELIKFEAKKEKEDFSEKMALHEKKMKKTKAIMVLLSALFLILSVSAAFILLFS